MRSVTMYDPSIKTACFGKVVQVSHGEGRWWKTRTIVNLTRAPTPIGRFPHVT